MLATCLRSGWRAPLDHPRLIVTVWLWNALLALVVGAGTWFWLGTAFNWAPQADQTLQRFSFGLLVELSQYDRFSPFTFLPGALLGVIVVGFFANALVAGGVLEVLVSLDRRSLLHRFFRGAGHFFGRFLRLLILNGIALLLALTLVSAITRPIVSAIGESSWERTWVAAAILRLLLLGAVAALGMAVLDIARTKIASSATELRGMLRVWFSAAGFLVRHFWTLAAIYMVLGACWVSVAVIGLGIVLNVNASTWVAIWFLVALQQAFMMARIGIRVARAGAVLAAVAGETPGVSTAITVTS